jgi:hypothetical protein
MIPRFALAALASLVLAAAVGGCRSSEQPTPSDTSGTTAQEPQKAEAPTAAAPADVPVEQDFEEQAGQQITSENLETELDKLEREIAQAP